MAELVSLRGENSKTYAVGKNRRQLVIGGGIQHWKEDYSDRKEQWKECDLTWEGNRITKAPYDLTVDGQKITFRDKKTGAVSTLELITVKPASASFKIIPFVDMVAFQHTLPNINVPFEAQYRIEGQVPRCRAHDDLGEIEVESSVKDGILTERLSGIKDMISGQGRKAQGQIRIDPTFNTQVSVSSDDCVRYYATSYWSITITSFTAGYGVSYPDGGSAARFLNVTIPEGATIIAARMTLRSAANNSNTIVRTRLRAQAADNPSTFSTSADFDGRTWTTARVNWDSIPTWLSGVDYTSPDIAACIQEVIDRPGWASGNALVVVWDDWERRSTQSSMRNRSGLSRDGSSTNPPKLVIKYNGTHEASASMALRLADAGVL